MKVKKQWPGVSGDGKQKDEKQNGGPIPEGKWVVLQRQRQHTPNQTWWQKLVNSNELKEFGTDRIGLIPFTKTETHGRKEFFIHGGKEAGSGYGIDLTDKMKGFVDEFAKGERDLVLVVKIKLSNSNKVVKKGDKGKIVEEINIRLAGFGGGVPADTFDEMTESKVINFQRDYMKMKTPTGEVDEKTARAVDEFVNSYPIDMQNMKCPCGTCGGYGRGQKKVNIRVM